MIGLVTSPSSPPVLYLDGVGSPLPCPSPASETVAGGYLMAGTGTGLYYGVPLMALYDFLGFCLYSGTVDESQAMEVSTRMLPRVKPAVNVVADGDSITQGTGSVFGHSMLRYVQPMLSEARGPHLHGAVRLPLHLRPRPRHSPDPHHLRRRPPLTGPRTS